jgi:HK97 family phage portal protein
MFDNFRGALAAWLLKPVTAAANSEQLLREMSRATGGAGLGPDGALAIAAYHRCIQLIAGPIATVPLDIKRRVDDRRRESAKDHPVSIIFRRRPNSWQTPSEFKRMMQAHVLMRGNGYARKIVSRGAVRSLVPLNPANTEPKQRRDGSIYYEHVNGEGRIITFEQEEIFHVRGLCLDGVKGLSVLDAARANLKFANVSSAHATNLFENKAAVSMIYKHPKALGDAAYKRLSQEIRDRSGPGNTGKSLILEEGMDATAITMTSTDAQWLESRKDNRLEIYMHFGVPPSLAGDTEKQTSFGTGVEAQVTGFRVFTMEDRFTAFEDAVNRDLLSDAKDQDMFARFNRNAFVRGDIKTRYEAYKVGRQWGWLSPDDVLSAEDMNPRPDGKGGDYAEPPNTAGVASPKNKDDSNDN